MLKHIIAPSLLVSLTAFIASADDSETRIVARWTFDSAAELEGWRVGRGIDGLRVEGGALRGTTTHPDAYVFAPPVRAPLDGLVVRVRWSAPVGGAVQCYWATAARPDMGEERVASTAIEGGRAVVTEFPLHGGARGDSLVAFRLDPLNGRVGAPFEIHDVELVSVGTRLEVVASARRPLVAVGEAAELRVAARHLGGRLPRGALAVTASSGGWSARSTLDLAANDAAASFSHAFTTPGVHVVAFRVEDAEAERTLHELECAVVAGALARPARVDLEDGAQALELLAGAGEETRHRAAALWLRERSATGASWRLGGLLMPLVESVVEANGLRRQRIHALEASRDGGTLSSALTLRGGDAWEVELELAFSAGRLAASGDVASRRWLRVAATARAPGGEGLLRFAGPALRVVPPAAERLLDRYGLFGGLEYLEPGWMSSSERAVGPKFAARWTPHPFKVCLPVMAIEQDGVTSAVIWHPEAEWSKGRRLPAATFASPNRIAASDEHLLSVFAPSVPDAVPENGVLAVRPVALSAGDTVRLETALRVAREPIRAAARGWYEYFGIPEPPPAPHDARTTHDLLARSWGETMYWPEERGWRAHWFLDRSSRFMPEAAAEIALHAKLTGERRWLEATVADEMRPLIDTLGTLWGRAHGGAGAARAAERDMRGDGTWAFRNTDEMRARTRQHSGGAFDSLGEDGSTSLGTCVQRALPLVRHWFLTADERSREPAERALAAMRAFRVPRGAQVWEVPQQVPDIRASALAVDAFRMAYIATGDTSYLDDAVRFAETGLAFLFTWRPPLDASVATARTNADREDFGERGALPLARLFQNPERQVNPYGTIPVLGTTFYVMSWFGVLVQWCGLEWAWHVNELLELRDDPVLRAAALGVTRSGLQQMFDRAPWTGLYPDVWNLEGNWAGGALIAPRLIAGALRTTGGLPQELRQWSRRVGEGESAHVVHGWGALRRCEASAEGIEIELDFLKGEPCELLITRASSPRVLRVNDAALQQGEGDDAWRHDEALGLVGLRFVSRGGNRVLVGF